MKKILCVLQNAWGDRDIPMIFEPNPYNHSAKVMRKVVGAHKMYFSNTTPVVTRTAKECAKADYKHFLTLIKEFPKFDLILVCGRQAAVTFDHNEEAVKAVENKPPMVFMKHPAARDVSKVYIDKLKEEINRAVSGFTV